MSDPAELPPATPNADTEQTPVTEAVNETPTAPAAESPVAPTQPQATAHPTPDQPTPDQNKTDQNKTDQSSGGGPLSLERIRLLRVGQQTRQDQRPQSRPTAAPKPPQLPADQPSAEAGGSKPPRGDRRPLKSRKDGTSAIPTPPREEFKPKVAVPSPRHPLSNELEEELNAALGGSDLDKLLVGDSMLQVGHELNEGQRLQGTVMKAHGEFVFIGLGGPNEGVIPALQFETLPEEGSQLDVVVRGFLADEGLYELTVPGSTVAVADWSDLQEGEVVEALITGANAGGLECKVGAIQGFIPASQAAEYRIENLADMVDQKVLCVVSEANPRRGNLVLSRRAVLEREKKEKREERLASLEIGSAVEGVVRKILDFGAFVDIGGIDGLLHISQLSWDRVKHPSEVLEEGQKIQVRVDKIDEQSGKIGLSYRSLQDDPWSDVESRFPVGSVVHGSVTRIAEFGAFVRIGTGVEGLVHVSELAHYRVHSVGSVVQEGKEIDVKVLAVDPEQQRISLSLKAAQAAPEAATEKSSQAEVEEPPPEPVLPKHRGPLKGGTNRGGGGEQFGLKW
ncbi:MAG: S1 RNA-binding domain-containing protein [Planctomycetales bacterium]|nr:S1 RNA-binding domain-containing protein [Planctomycetales bacterium]